MPKWQLLDQGVQGLNIYRQAKMQGNQQMMQQGLDLVAQASNALRGITDVQQARQTMELQRTAEARTQQLFPLQMQAQRQATQMGQIELGREQKLEEAYQTIAQERGEPVEVTKARVEALETVGKGMVAEAGIATERERQKRGYYPAGVEAEAAEMGRRREEAVTGEARAEAERPYVQAEAAAAGAKATYEKLSAMTDIRNMPAEEVARLAETESREWQARFQKGVAVNEVNYIVSDKERNIELIKEQINLLKKRGQAYEAQALEALLAKQTDDMGVLKEVRALASDIQSAYMALARLEAGEDVLDQLAKIGSATGMKMNLGAMGADTGDREALKQNIIAHISILKSLINRHGYQYDITSTPPTFRMLSPSERQMPPGGGGTVQYEQYRRDLPQTAPQTYREREPTAPLGPPSPGETDVNTILDAFGL